MNEPAAKQWVIVGLGNPGKKYAFTRHNLGALVVEAFALQCGLKWKEEAQFNAAVATGKLDDTKIHLLLPRTYMNESGRAVRRYLDFHKLKADGLIVVCDDVALPLGQMRLRLMGSSGGHNGLKSIQDHLQTKHFMRLRMGIEGEALQQQPLEAFVLDRFSPIEKELLPEFLERGVATLRQLLTQEIAAVMNVANTKQRPTDEGKKKGES